MKSLKTLSKEIRSSQQIMTPNSSDIKQQRSFDDLKQLFFSRSATAKTLSSDFSSLEIAADSKDVNIVRSNSSVPSNVRRCILTCCAPDGSPLQGETFLYKI